MRQGKKLVIIMGAQRSGTTWLQAMLAAHETVCTHSELWLFSNYTSQWLKAWEHQIAASENSHKIGLPLVYTRDELIDQLREFIDNVYAKYTAECPDASIILDKTPGYVHYTEHIHELVPDVHFIHIIRDGRDVVASRLAAGRTWWTSQKQFNAQDFAREWVKSVKHGHRAQTYPTQYTEIRYEDLLNNGVETLQHVYQAIGLEVEKSWLEQVYADHSIEKMRQNYTQDVQKSTNTGIFRAKKSFYRKGKWMAWQDDLTLLEKFQVYRVANPTLKKWGYAESDTWWVSGSLMGWLLWFAYSGFRHAKRVLGN